MFRFTIRELVLLTLVVAMAAGWWVDRSALAWRHAQSVATAERLRDRLDAADPQWRARDEQARIPNKFDQAPEDPTVAYFVGAILGATLFGLVIFIVVLVWQGKLHWSVLKERPRF